MTSYRDWVVELSNTTGTGPYSLAGAPAGTSYFTFRQRYANGEDEIVLWVVNPDRSKWEKNRFSTLAYGTPDMLSRAVVESTNGDAPVSWVGADLPLRLYVVPDADAEEFAITMGLGAARPDVLKFGLWVDEDDVSSGVHSLKFFDGTSDAILGKIDSAQHKFTSAFMPCGATIPFIGPAAPAGWILASGLTIGDASSSATGRANADTLDLFTLLYNWADAQAAVSGGRGANAAADFAAHKTIALPDLSGRVVAGQDDMSGTSRNRLTAAGSGLDGDVLGGTGGAETHTHTVTGTTGGPSTVTGAEGNAPTINVADINHTHVLTTTSAASTTVQPTIVLNYIIKL